MTDPILTNPILPGQPASGGQPQQSSKQSNEVTESSFSETLSQQQVRFSNHAQKRLERRNITLSDDGMTRLADAVEKAEKRGGRESLVLVDDLAFIVNVRERLVVTALDRNRAGDGVFTQIDSVVFADPSESTDSTTSTSTNDNQGEADSSHINTTA